MSAIPIRNTDVPTDAPAASMPSSSATAPPVTHDQADVMVAIGKQAQSVMRNGGGGNVALLVALLVAFGMWVSARVDNAEATAEAARMASEKTAGYEARLVRIELSLESYAHAAADIPAIKTAVERLIEDQRKTQGAVDLLVKRIAPPEREP